MRRENAESRAAEERLIDALCQTTGAKAHKLPIRYSIDYLMMRGSTTVAWVEVKERKNPRARYPTYTVSLYKYLNLLDLAAKTGVPGLILVGWSDGVGWVKVPCDHEIIWSGRTDRGDAGDVEPMVSIPISAFRMLKHEASSNLRS
jgi:hypothetical protein